MSLLWIMVGLTLIVLLVLNLVFLKKNRKEAKRRLLKELLDKELIFQQRCETFELSPREMDVLRLILEGHTYRSAADILFISEKTVDSHMQNIYNKVGIRNRVGLIIKFYS